MLLAQTRPRREDRCSAGRRIVPPTYRFPEDALWALLACPITPLLPS